MARSTYALRAFAWGVAEWAKQFTAPAGTLAFPSPDERRALEIRLTVLAVLAAERHWTDLSEVDRAAVDCLFTLTLGPGMREAWQHQRKQIGSVGGAPVLLRCHELQHYPEAAISLNTALTTLSADGLGGQLARDPEGQSLVLGILERVSTACDAIFRKHCPPGKDMTYQDMYFDLLEHIDRAREASQAPQPAWRRLRIQSEGGGNDLAILDGTTYRLKAQAATFLQALQERQGDMVLAQTLTTMCGNRADRIYRALPDPLKQIVDRPTKKGQGYRIL